MEGGRAFAEALDREVKRRRSEALANDPRSSFWTDRDIARRMTEAGHKMHHPAVILARQGKRAVTVEEWLTFAFVLSIPPHRLLEPDRATLTVGKKEHQSREVRDWLAGARPLAGTEEPPIFYGTLTKAGPRPSDYFAGVLRSFADQFDTAREVIERQELAEEIILAAVHCTRNDRQLRRASARPRGRITIAKLEMPKPQRPARP
jgi:hypothetical protein